MTREEAIKELRCFIGQLTEGCQEVIKVLIPELKESADERIRKEAAKIEKRVKKYSSLTIKSWENIEPEYQKDHRWPRAVAAVDEEGWFSVAMNCMRDGDMGFQDRDGVYERFWWTDEAGDIDLHNATPEEADLYLKKVDMLDILGRPQCERGAISVIRLDGVTYIIYPTD